MCLCCVRMVQDILSLREDRRNKVWAAENGRESFGTSRICHFVYVDFRQISYVLDGLHNKQINIESFRKDCELTIYQKVCGTSFGCFKCMPIGKLKSSPNSSDSQDLKITWSAFFRCSLLGPVVLADYLLVCAYSMWICCQQLKTCEDRQIGKDSLMYFKALAYLNANNFRSLIRIIYAMRCCS